MINAVENISPSRLSEKIVKTLIIQTKKQHIIWNNIQQLPTPRISRALYNYQQSLLIDKFVLNKNTSYYAIVKDTMFFCLSFNDIKTDKQMIHICIYRHPQSRLKHMEIKDNGLVERLSNLVHFSTLTSEELKTTMDLSFLRTVISDLEDN